MLDAEDNLAGTHLLISGLKEFPKHIAAYFIQYGEVCLDHNDEPT